MIEIRVGSQRAVGPLFDGSIQVDVRAFTTEAVETVALEGQQGVRTLGMSQYQNPTGFYSSRVRTRLETPERAVVHDSMVVYGPWLEGIGSRNATSRFKGYRTWRMTRDRVRRAAPTIAVRVLKRYMPRWT